MSLIFYTHLSIEISLAYKEHTGPVLIVNKIDRASGKNVRVEVHVNEDEWRGIKDYMEKVYS